MASSRPGREGRDQAEKRKVCRVAMKAVMPVGRGFLLDRRSPASGRSQSEQHVNPGKENLPTAGAGLQRHGRSLVLVGIPNEPARTALSPHPERTVRTAIDKTCWNTSKVTVIAPAHGPALIANRDLDPRAPHGCCEKQTGVCTTLIAQDETNHATRLGEEKRGRQMPPALLACLRRRLFDLRIAEILRHRVVRIVIGLRFRF